MPGNTSKRYPAELKARAVRMYHETRPDYEGDWPAMVKVAELVPRKPCAAGSARTRSTTANARV